MDNTKKMQKNAKKYECFICHFITSNKTNFYTHLETEKHKKAEIIQNNNDFVQKMHFDERFHCECGKSYKHKPNLYAHKKKCDYKENSLNEEKNNNNEENNQLKLLNENDKNEENLNYKEIISELKNIILEQNNTIRDLIPKIGNNNNNVNNITNNQNLNISLFLNENCKDAISIVDFVKQIEISIQDLLFTKQNGFINGISNIFIENLNKLPPIQRPLWCGDKKRKKLYIKESQWNEDIDNIKTKQAIKELSFKQVKNIKKYTDANADWSQKDHKKDEYVAIVKNTTESIDNKDNQIINNVIHHIYLDKYYKNIITE